MIDHFVNSTLFCFHDIVQAFRVSSPLLCLSCLVFVTSFLLWFFTFFYINITLLYLQRYLQQLSFLASPDLLLLYDSNAITA